MGSGWEVLGPSKTIASKIQNRSLNNWRMRDTNDVIPRVWHVDIYTPLYLTSNINQNDSIGVSSCLVAAFYGCDQQQFSQKEISITRPWYLVRRPSYPSHPPIILGPTPPSVTAISRHIAGTLPSTPLRCVPSFALVLSITVSREECGIVSPVDSRRILRTWAIMIYRRGAFCKPIVLS